MRRRRDGNLGGWAGLVLLRLTVAVGNSHAIGKPGEDNGRVADVTLASLAANARRRAWHVLH